MFVEFIFFCCSYCFSGNLTSLKLSKKTILNLNWELHFDLWLFIYFKSPYVYLNSLKKFCSCFNMNYEYSF